MLVNATVDKPRPTLDETLVTVLKSPPATDCCSEGRDDMTYMLVTVNSKSAPTTESSRAGKVSAHQEMLGWVALRRALEMA